jgi:hypothetical protein
MNSTLGYLTTDGRKRRLKAAIRATLIKSRDLWATAEFTETLARFPTSNPCT